MSTHATLAQALAGTPAAWAEDLLPAIQEQVAASQRKIVVLDDDPTGTQTVYDIPVLTSWSVALLAAELQDDGAPAFYILTNSRSLPADEAAALNREIGQNLAAAARQSGRDYVVVSRSDSTLRGHYPVEVDALAAAGGRQVDGCLIIPFFVEGGRVTLNDIHYVMENERLVPAAETPFAADKAFGYASSNLRDWVQEKTDGRVRRDEVHAISLQDVREGGPARVTQRLLEMAPGATCIVNAVEYRDMEVFVAGLLGAEAAGKRYLYRTAASFVRVRAGLAARPLLTAAEMGQDPDSAAGGLIVVGSYVPKTTTQLETLLAQTAVRPVEIDVQQLMEDAAQAAQIADAAQQVEEAIGAGQDVVLYTSRTLVSGHDARSSLAIGQRVSDSLIAILKALKTQPRFLIAKGGITSSDVATKALGIQRARVMGQILPGIPVWSTGPESRYPGLSYVVFPGNVGGDDALVEALQRLTRRASSA